MTTVENIGFHSTAVTPLHYEEFKVVGKCHMVSQLKILCWMWFSTLVSYSYLKCS